jgi:hypothetical protein
LPSGMCLRMTDTKRPGRCRPGLVLQLVLQIMTDARPCAPHVI